MIKEPNGIMLISYLRGETSPEETNNIEQWINNDHTNKKILLEEFKIDYATKTSEYNRYVENNFGKYNLIFKYEFVFPEEHKEKLKLLNNLKNIGKTEVQVNENELKFILRFL